MKRRNNLSEGRIHVGIGYMVFFSIIPRDSILSMSRSLVMYWGTTTPKELMTSSESTEVTAYGLICKYFSCASCSLEEKYSQFVVNGSMRNSIERVSLFDFNVYSMMVAIEVGAAVFPDCNSVVGSRPSYAAIRSSRVEGTGMTYQCLVWSAHHQMQERF